LLNLIEQSFGTIGEKKMGLVEEENQFRLGLIAYLRQLLEKFGEQL